MNQLPWFRMYSEAVDDEKLRLLAFEDRWHFVAILCCKAKGILDVPENLLLRKVAVKLGVDLRTLEEVIRRLSEVGLIDKNTLQPLAWNERQYVSDSSTERVKAYRERVKRSRNVSETAQETDTEADTETKTEEKRGTPRKRSATFPQPADVDQQTWADWLTLRKAKRAPVTQTTVDGARQEAAKADMPLEAFLKVWCRRGSQGLESDWLKPSEKPNAMTANSQTLSFADRDELARHKRYKEMTGRDWPADLIDIVDATPNQMI